MWRNITYLTVILFNILMHYFHWISMHWMTDQQTKIKDTCIIETQGTENKLINKLNCIKITGSKQNRHPLSY